MSNIYIVKTNGDCEGRSTKTIGYFKADTLEQIAEFIETNGIEYIYDYTIELIGYTDVTDIKPVYIDKVNKGKFGAIEKILTAKGAAELSRLKAKNKALSKLTPEEQRAILY